MTKNNLILLSFFVTVFCSFQQKGPFHYPELPGFYFNHNTASYSFMHCTYEDSSMKKQDSVRSLAELKSLLMKHKSSRIQLLGCADIAEKNPDSLGRARAKKVRADLGVLGCDTLRIKTGSYGIEKVLFGRDEQLSPEKYKRTKESIMLVNRRVVVRYI